MNNEEIWTEEGAFSNKNVNLAYVLFLLSYDIAHFIDYKVNEIL